MKNSMRITVAAACVLLIGASIWIVNGINRSGDADQAASPQGAVASDPVAEVLANIRAQPVGDHTVADYDLPEEFLRRVADRIIRESYEEQFRIVVADNGAEILGHANAQSELNGQPSTPDRSLQPEIRIIDWQESEHVARLRAEVVEGYPPLPGFRAALLTEAERPWPYRPPGEDAPPGIRRAAQIVGRQLARDGLMWTAAQAVEAIGPQTIADETDDVALLDMLRSVGLPVDLIEHFRLANHSGAASLIRWMADELSNGKRAIDLRSTMDRIPFDFSPSWPGFQVATESGEHELTAVRMQQTRGGYWDGVGDGGNIDLLRQIMEAIPDVKIIAAIERKHLEEFKVTKRTWSIDNAEPMDLIAVDRPLAQWAQDNGKSGLIRSQPATMVPRYASRGEVGAIVVPGETYVMDSVAAAKHRVVQSPLLFQGGNMITVRHPVSGERLLLIGEAEIYRNHVLGLSREQVVEAFRIEFGVDQCIVLPTVSFHIDMDVCVRAHDGRLVAFVNDTPKAAAIVLEIAIDVMKSHDLLSDVEVESAVDDLRAQRWSNALQLVGPALHARSDGHGQFPSAFAQWFSTGPVDSGVGNLLRVLQALDTLAAVSLTSEKLEANATNRAYMNAIARREADRIALQEHLKELGFDVVPVPSLADGSRGINAVNGIHARGVYLMPSYGGLLGRLDTAAMACFVGALGDHVKIVPILTGESQRRSGAVHCSISPIYGLPLR